MLGRQLWARFFWKRGALCFGAGLLHEILCWQGSYVRGGGVGSGVGAASPNLMLGRELSAPRFSWDGGKWCFCIGAASPKI